MTPDETWALFKQGKDVWNAWADDMLAERKRLEESGLWVSSSTQWTLGATADFARRAMGTPVSFAEYVFPGDADFSGTRFSRDADFDGARFEGKAKFNGTRFERNTNFNSVRFVGNASFAGAIFDGAASLVAAEFSGGAEFSEAHFGKEGRFSFVKFNQFARFRWVRFNNDALFDEAEFRADASFQEVSFIGSAIYEEAVFKEQAVFLQATFEGFTTFAGTSFDGLSDFGALESKRAFSLAGVIFRQVPDFFQAGFAQAPRLDELTIKLSNASSSPRRTVIGSLFKADQQLEARWRALKRLAIQSHDNARELDFFAEELKARRELGGWKQIGVLIVSFLYQWLSNYGRSIGLPLFWLLVTLAVFYGVYLSNHSAFVEKDQWGSVWTWEKLTSYLDDREIPVDACEVGSEDSNAANAAVALSWRNTIPLTGLGAPEKLNQVYRCLYGVEDSAASPGFPESRLPPRIPDRIAFYSVLQTVISAVLIFLLLLAVRNHFRIK